MPLAFLAGRTGGDGYGDFNESGLGRNMNYDRFGNERTEMPDWPC